MLIYWQGKDLACPTQEITGL